jgi:hypothetical protein
MSTTSAQDKANPPPLDDGMEYDLDYILKNPIHTSCLRCKRKEPINAPQLYNVRCFWCGGKLFPLDLKAYHQRLADLWRHVAGGPIAQMSLFDGGPR